ncbi:MAG: transposase [Bacteroidales bacterium]
MPFNGVIDVKDDKSDNAGNVANMSRITVKLNLPNKKNKRNECGYFHVWFRGSNRYTVFYDDTDFIGFLKHCNKTALKYDSKISAFVIMNNHVHLQVYTPNLSKFIKALLIGFTQWLNRQKNLKGSIFEGPFSSSPIYSLDILERNLLYILTNPVRAGICNSIKHYPWSSYHFLKADSHNPLHKIIDIDTSVMKSVFTTIDALNRKAESFLALETSLDFQKIINNKADIQRHRVPDSEIARYLKSLLNGRGVDDLSNDEFGKMVKILKFRENATIQQIAALTHESYSRIRKFSL